jgi:hypothetical protein
LCFVINGENSNNYSGHSVSSAGDVNGDGLDDLIVGAFGMSKSYVIFGQKESTSDSGVPTIKSSKPSPLTSPALEIERPLLSPVFSPLMTKPPVTQQSIYLLLPVAQGALSLSARMRMIGVAIQSPVQVISTAMAWMI